MIVGERDEVISPFPVWARGGQAPLRAQTALPARLWLCGSGSAVGLCGRAPSGGGVRVRRPAVTRASVPRILAPGQEERGKAAANPPLPAFVYPYRDVGGFKGLVHGMGQVISD